MKMKSAGILGSISLFVAVGAGCSGAGEYEPQISSHATVQGKADNLTPLDSAFAAVEESGFSGVVGIATNGNMTFRDFGSAADDGVPADETQVDLNSITKTVTGVMLLKLAEQGKVDFDETLPDFFNGVPTDKVDITVHHLLTHSSGLPGAIGDDSERIGREDYLQRVFNTPLLFKPGERYEYSNTGYSVLAAIIEVRSRKSYESYLRKDVLAPIGLVDTGYQTIYDTNQGLKSRRGKTIEDASWGGHDPYWNLIGNGGLISTPRDFIRFRQAFVNGDIVSVESVQIGQTKHVAEDDEGTSYYGYGLVIQDNEHLGRFTWHDGGNDIFSAQWNHFMDRGGDIIFTAGTDNKQSDAFLAMEIVVNQLYGKLLSEDD